MAIRDDAPLWARRKDAGLSPVWPLEESGPFQNAGAICNGFLLLRWSIPCLSFLAHERVCLSQDCHMMVWDCADIIGKEKRLQSLFYSYKNIFFCRDSWTNCRWMWFIFVHSFLLCVLCPLGGKILPITWTYLMQNSSAATELMHVTFSLKVPKW